MYHEGNWWNPKIPGNAGPDLESEQFTNQLRDHRRDAAR